MREYAFEVRLCAHIEREHGAVVARQLGGGVVRPGGRVFDAVLVEPGANFETRAAITPETVPTEAIESDVGPGRARRPGEAFDCHPDRAREVTNRCVEIGFFERERDGRIDRVRAVTRYPEDWFSIITAVENKPDLGDPGALETQLRKDVSLGLADRVVLATESHVTGAHRNRIPDAVGIWRFRPEEDRLDVLREPTPLAVTEPGVELLACRPGRADVRVVDGERKARARRRVAERAYGKGWRPTFPGCDRVREADDAADARGVPDCAWKGRVVDPGRECGPSCPGFVAADPPAVDAREDRDARTPFVADPDGLDRKQTGLDRFG